MLYCYTPQRYCESCSFYSHHAIVLHTAIMFTAICWHCDKADKQKDKQIQNCIYMQNTENLVVFVFKISILSLAPGRLGQTNLPCICLRIMLIRFSHEAQSPTVKGDETFVSVLDSAYAYMSSKKLKRKSIMVFLFYILMHFKRKVLFRESPQFLPSNPKLLNCLTYCRTSVQSQTETGETSSPVGSEFQKMGRKN